MSSMISIVALCALAGSVNGQWELKDGTNVSFAFYQPSKQLAWRPDTSLVDHEIISRNLPENYFSKEQGTVLIAWIHPLTQLNPLDGPTVRFKLPSTDQEEAQLTWLTRDGIRWLSAWPTPKGQPSQQDVAIGIALGNWKVAGTTTYGRAKSGIRPRKQKGISFQPEVIEDQHSLLPMPKDAKDSAFVTVRFKPYGTLQGADFRIVATDRKGKDMESMGSGRVGGPMARTEFYFKGTLRDVARIELLTREFEWKTIKAAHFRPN